MADGGALQYFIGLLPDTRPTYRGAGLLWIFALGMAFRDVLGRPGQYQICRHRASLWPAQNDGEDATAGNREALTAMTGSVIFSFPRAHPSFTPFANS